MKIVLKCVIFRGVEGLAVPSKLYAYLAAGSAVIALVGQERACKGNSRA